MTLDTQRAAVERLQRRVDALRGRPGWNVHVGLLRAAVHELMRMEAEAARDG